MSDQCQACGAPVTRKHLGRRRRFCLEAACLKARNVAYQAEWRQRNGLPRTARRRTPPTDVLLIRRLCELGRKQGDVAEAFGVGRSTISRIASGATWSQLERIGASEDVGAVLGGKR